MLVYVDQWFLATSDARPLVEAIRKSMHEDRWEACVLSIRRRSERTRYDFIHLITIITDELLRVSFSPSPRAESTSVIPVLPLSSTLIP